MARVAAEGRRVLRPGGIRAWIMADECRGGAYTPVGFRLLSVLSHDFEVRDTAVLDRHHDRSASPLWEHRARRFNFFLRGFTCLFILSQPVGASGGQSPGTERRTGADKGECESVSLARRGARSRGRA